MDINVVLSGFIGSFLGVLSGFLGAIYLDWQRTRRERRTHIVALTRELLSNNVRIQLLLKEGRREGSLEDRAWRELRVALAGELPMEFYNRLASRYDAIGPMRKIFDELAEGEAEAESEAGEKLQLWAEGMMEENERLRHEAGDSQGLMRAVRRRQHRHAERIANEGKQRESQSEPFGR